MYRIAHIILTNEIAGIWKTYMAENKMTQVLRDTDNWQTKLINKTQLLETE